MSFAAVVNPDGPLMNLRMVLECDGQHGLLPPAEFDQVGASYMELMARAKGWRRVKGKDGANAGWRGPCCP